MECPFYKTSGVSDSWNPDGLGLVRHGSTKGSPTRAHQPPLDHRVLCRVPGTRMASTPLDHRELYNEPVNLANHHSCISTASSTASSTAICCINLPGSLIWSILFSLFQLLWLFFSTDLWSALTYFYTINYTIIFQTILLIFLPEKL